MTTNKHMVSDPNARALTIGGKNAGGAPKDPIVIRVKDIANAAAIIAKLKADGTDPFTHVTVVENRFDTRLVDGRLKDLQAVFTFSVVTTASTNATNVKAGPGDIAGWSVVNTSAAIRYVRLYNKATVPVPASDAALIVARIPLAAGQRSDLMLVSAHIWCSAGIGFDVTAGAADSDATVTAAGDVTLTLFFD